MALIAPNLFKIEKWLYKLGHFQTSAYHFSLKDYILFVDMVEWEKDFESYYLPKTLQLNQLKTNKNKDN